MKFLVCIKQVPDVSGNIQTGRAVLNAYDASALEAALVLSEGTENEIQLVLIGPESAKETIRKALAMGAHGATHIITDVDMPLNSAAIAARLAEFARGKEFDVIACGKQSQDTDAGLTGGMLAQYLALPFATNAVHLEWSDPESPEGILVTRQGDIGQEILSLPTPCLVTCSNDMNNPRIPSLRGIMLAKKKPIDSENMDSSVVCNTLVTGMEDPPSRPPSRFLAGEAVEQVSELMRVLEEEAGIF